MSKAAGSSLDGSASDSSPGKSKKTLWAWTIATFFGAGFWKPGPGTAGSIAATLIWWLAGWLFGHLAIHIENTVVDLEIYLPWITAAAALLLLAIAIPAATIVARETGRKDPQIVVADEVVGQWITLIAAPAGWGYALIGLVLFRLFDITKPPPIRKIEHLREGWGIMLDDVGAGVYALIVLQIIHHWMR
jgi:phosphatidylglycerophosphatase A